MRGRAPVRLLGAVLLGAALLGAAAADLHVVRAQQTPGSSGASPGKDTAARDATPMRWLPLLVHVVEQDGQPVAEEAFIRERIERANQIYAPYHIGFVVQKRVPLAAAHAHLETRADRDALAQYVQRKVIDCFVVASLRDVDDPEQMRRGVHWHAATKPGAHYVIISTLGDPGVLSHELGHYLGNPEHSPTPGNLMSYERGPMLPFLDDAQQARVAHTVRGYLKRGELVLAKAPQPVAAGVGQRE